MLPACPAAFIARIPSSRLDGARQPGSATAASLCGVWPPRQAPQHCRRLLLRASQGAPARPHRHRRRCRLSSLPFSSSSPSSRIFLLAPGLFRGRATRAVSGGGGGRWQARSFPRSHSASSCRPALSSRVDPSCRGAAPRRQNNNWHLRRTCPKHDGNHTPRAFRSVGPNRGRCRDCHRRARGQSFEPGWLIERWLAQAAAWSSPTSPHQKKDLSALKKQSSK